MNEKSLIFATQLSEDFLGSVKGIQVGSVLAMAAYPKRLECWIVNTAGRIGRSIVDPPPEPSISWRADRSVEGNWLADGKPIGKWSNVETALYLAENRVTVRVDPIFRIADLPCFISPIEHRAVFVNARVQFAIRTVAELPDLIASQAESNWLSRQRLSMFAKILADPNLEPAQNTAPPSNITLAAREIPLRRGLHIPMQIVDGPRNVRGVLFLENLVNDHVFDCSCWCVGDIALLKSGGMLERTVVWHEGKEQKSVTARLGVLE